jgi:hypothetical protein
MPKVQWQKSFALLSEIEAMQVTLKRPGDLTILVCWVCADINESRDENKINNDIVMKTSCRYKIREIL